MRHVTAALTVTTVVVAVAAVLSFVTGGFALVTLGAVLAVIAGLLGVAAWVSARGADGVSTLNERRAELERRRKA